jgi:hypothetical protein
MTSVAVSSSSRSCAWLRRNESGRQARLMMPFHAEPLLRSGRGRAVWHDAASRLLRLAPDLRGDVIAWAGRDDVVFIDVRLSATVGGKPLAFRSFDKLLIGPGGRVVRREASFDPAPVALALLLRPTAWLRAVRLLLGR